MVARPQLPLFVVVSVESCDVTVKLLKNHVHVYVIKAQFGN